MIELHNVSKRFGGERHVAVRDVSLTVRDGETLSLLGSSGSGKTTTLKMINRLVEPSEGRIMIGGEDVRSMDVLGLRRSIGYVFQDIGLFPHLTVEQNIEMVPRLLGVRRAERRRRVRVLMEQVGLEPRGYATRRPRELSGGQQQRVGLARALAADPPYLLMDEPFGALDAVTRGQMQAELLSLKASLRKTIVFVTHDMFAALRIGDRVGVMNRGRLEQVGTREELLDRPATAFVAELVAHARRQAALLNGSVG